MPVYSDVFNWDKKFYPTQKEVIFGVQFGSNGSSVTQNITCRMFSPSGLGGSGSFVVNNNLFRKGDPSHGTIRRNSYLAHKGGTTKAYHVIYKKQESQHI